jgi:nucleoside transporter
LLSRVQRTTGWKLIVELCTLFFLHGMAMGSWFVPLGTVLDGYHLELIKPFAFATSAIAAFVSPLFFGAMADRHVAPTRVLQWLALGTAMTMSAIVAALRVSGNPWLVLALIQLQALCLAPTWGITNSIVFGQLRDSQRQFGPIRAVATLGWIVGCWIVSALHADRSFIAFIVSGSVWALLGAFVTLLPAIAPVPNPERLTARQRLGLDALVLFKDHNHRVVFLTVALFAIPLAAFYPYTPTHLRDLGLERTSAWMSMGQVTEMLAMIALPHLLVRWRLKQILGLGLAFGLLRYVLCALNEKAWVLAGLSLHGLTFTLFFITVQIYLDRRIDTAWRTRAQSLYTVMLSGVGNFVGYLGTGAWLHACRSDGVVRWNIFWSVLAVIIAGVCTYFLSAYRSRTQQTS